VNEQAELKILSTVENPFVSELRFSFQSSSTLFLGLDYYAGMYAA
jgi:hypothetical protein